MPQEIRLDTKAQDGLNKLVAATERIADALELIQKVGIGGVAVDPADVAALATELRGAAAPLQAAIDNAPNL